MNRFLYQPRYSNTDEIVSLVAQIAARVDVLAIQNGMEQSPKLRRVNRILTVHSSLAIENNSLSIDQVSALMDGKRILAPPEDICEVENAFKVYNKLLDFNPYDSMDLLAAHSILMKDLVKEAGRFRSGNVGVFKGIEVVHIAPPAENVSGLVADLLVWAKNAKVHPLIKSCVFHYEFEIIHPFQDGNGRMGRMWQTLLLYQWKKIFAWLPVETIVWQHQQEYYAALEKANDKADCTQFIAFMLKSVWEALNAYAAGDQASDQASDQVKRLLAAMDTKEYSAIVLMEKLNLKHRPTFRKNYLHPAIEQGLLEMTLPKTPNARGQKYKKKQ